MVRQKELGEGKAMFSGACTNLSLFIAISSNLTRPGSSGGGGIGNVSAKKSMLDKCGDSDVIPTTGEISFSEAS